MTRIEVIVKPFNLDKVMQALLDVGIAGATCCDVQNHVRQSSMCSGEHALPMAQLEVVAPDHLVGPMIEAIRLVTKTVSPDDSRILVGLTQLQK